MLPEQKGDSSTGAGRSCCWALGLVFVVTRLATIYSVPLFTDEAVYLRWAARIVQEGASWVVSLEETGVQPLLIWLGVPLVSLPLDPMLAGRTISVVLGLVTLTGLYRLGSRLQGSRAGLAAAGSYLVMPTGLVYDRLFLSESILVAVTPWIWLCALGHVRSGRLVPLAGVALLSGLGYLAKSSVVVPLVALVCAMVASRPPLARLASVTVSVLLGYGACRLALLPWSASIAGRDYRVARQPLDLLQLSPLELGQVLLEIGQVFMIHLGWLCIYLTPLVWLLALGFSLWGLWWRDQALRWVGVGLTAELLILAMALRSDSLNPRYLAVITPLVCLVIAVGVCQLKVRTVVQLLLLVAALLPAAGNSALMALSPSRAFLPDTERFQLLTGWPSGWGLRELIDYLRRKHPNEPIGVWTEGPLGLIPQAVELYLPPEWVLSSNRPTLGRVLHERQQLEQWLQDRPCYVLLNDPPGPRSGPRFLKADPAGLAPVKTILKPGGQYAFRLYRIPPDWFVEQ